jgi:putative acetyltransferase
MEMNIRRMDLQDYPSVKQLWIDCGLTEEPEDCIEDIGKLLSLPQSAGFVADANGKIEGAALCGDDGRYGYIHHLAVSGLHRNKGVGRSLVRACVSFLKNRHILVMVRERNDAGNEFWKRLCFHRVDGLSIQYLKENS